MAEGKKSFVLYCDQREIFEQLSLDKRGELISVIFNYVSDLDPDPIITDPVIKMAFTHIKLSLKRDLKKYEKRAETSRLNGSLGGRPPINPVKPTKPNGLIDNPTEPRKPDTVSVSVNDNVNDIIKRKEIKEKYAFEKCSPSLEKLELEEFEKFFSYWSEHGENDKKMRFEKEKSFDWQRRWDVWNKNKKKWSKDVNDKKEKKRDASDIILEKYDLK